jgi:hypothetical protein
MNLKTRTILIVAILALCSSCSMFRAKWPPAVDPLQGWNGWHEYGEDRHSRISKTIKDDYQIYLQKHERHYYPLDTTFYEDGTGRHAVKVLFQNWDHELLFYIFIYDKSNTRTKVMQFFYCRTFC